MCVCVFGMHFHRLPFVYKEVVGNDGGHGSPRPNVDVDWPICDNGRILQGVVIDNSDNALDVDRLVELADLLVIHEAYTGVSVVHLDVLNRLGSCHAPVVETEFGFVVHFTSSSGNTTEKFCGADGTGDTRVGVRTSGVWVIEGEGVSRAGGDEKVRVRSPLFPRRVSCVQ